MVERGVTSDGFTIQLLPATSAGASFQHTCRSGSTRTDVRTPKQSYLASLTVPRRNQHAHTNGLFEDLAVHRVRNAASLNLLWCIELVSFFCIEFKHGRHVVHVCLCLGKCLAGIFDFDFRQLLLVLLEQLRDFLQQRRPRGKRLRCPRRCILKAAGGRDGRFSIVCIGFIDMCDDGCIERLRRRSAGTFYQTTDSHSMWVCSCPKRHDAILRR